MKIGTRLIGSYIVVSLLAGGVALLALRATGSVQTAVQHTAAATVPIVDTLNDARFTVLRIVTSVSEFRALKQEEAGKGVIGHLPDAEEQHILQAFTALDQALMRYRTLAEGRPKDLATFRHISAESEQFKQATRNMIALLEISADNKVFSAAQESFEHHETELLNEIQSAVDDTSVTLKQEIDGTHTTLESARTALLAVGLATFILAIIIGTTLSRHISGPLIRLKNASQRIAKGELDAEVTVHTGDELEDLADTFNHMARDLERSNHELLAAKHYTDDIIHSMPDALLVVDAQGAIQRVNKAGLEMLEYTEETLLKLHIHQVLVSENASQGDAQPPPPREGEIHTFTGDIIPVSVSYSAISVETGQTERGVYLLQDISARKQAEHHLNYLATHDVLTGLPNRLLFIDRLEQAISRAPWHKRLVAVLFLDMDRFKIINDTLGHDVGDQLLQAAAERLVTCVRPGDTVARLGGDEYAILLTDVASANDITDITQKITHALSVPMELAGRELFLTTSVGISVFPTDGADPITLMRNADTAMYRAKEHGKNTYQHYSPAMNESATERMAMEQDLRRALERTEFVLFYQPQVDLHTGRICGMEALLRWQHPKRGLVPPLAFIPLAEETGLMVPIGEWVLREACRQTKVWHEAGYDHLRVAVNLSNRQFRQTNLVRMVDNILRETGLPADALELELTESIVMRDADAAVDRLHALKAMGVELSIDDFGTGYSSLAYLKRLPVDTLKVDRSFIKDIPRDQDDAAITAAIIAMAHQLRLSVVAEGVEDLAQIEFLKTQNCDAMQGFYYSPPVHSDAFARLLREPKSLAAAQAGLRT